MGFKKKSSTKKNKKIILKRENFQKNILNEIQSR